MLSDILASVSEVFFVWIVPMNMVQDGPPESIRGSFIARFIQDRSVEGIGGRVFLRVCPNYLVQHLHQHFTTLSSLRRPLPPCIKQVIHFITKLFDTILYSEKWDMISLI
jgi:hypothetical protein